MCGGGLGGEGKGGKGKRREVWWMVVVEVGGWGVESDGVDMRGVFMRNGNLKYCLSSSLSSSTAVTMNSLGKRHHRIRTHALNGG